MAYSLNRVDLIGNLGADPEIRTFASGGKIASLSLATSTRWKDRQTGEVKEKTEWHRVEIRSDFLAEIAGRLKKGMTVCVSGRLETRKWQDRSGADRWSTDVVVSGYTGALYVPNVRDLGGARDEGGARDGRSSPPAEDRRDPSPGLDDEIPF